MSHRPLTPSALAMALVLGLVGAAQAAPTATTPQSTPRPADGKAGDGRKRHGFFCNMDAVEQGQPAAGDRVLASGDDKGEDKDKDKGGGKKVPLNPAASINGLQQQPQRQGAVTPQ